MELHTLGVDGGYTQNDVLNVARCLTGFTYVSDSSNPAYGHFTFRSSNHDNGAKTVLGVPIASGGGYNDALIVYTILANHPSTARFISRKLARWLLRYDPRQTLVDRVAQVFLSTGGDITSMVREILQPENLEESPLLLKRPFHLLVSALRALRVTVTNITNVRTQLGNMGQQLYNWAPPNGYPHSLDYWGGLILARWNVSFMLASGQISGAAPNIPLLTAGAVTASQIVDRINMLFMAGEMPPAEKSALLAYLLPDNPSTTRIRDAMGLALAAPSFQWH
jgi:uncharacterized protein (DUF1800 family)